MNLQIGISNKAPTTRIIPKMPSSRAVFFEIPICRFINCPLYYPFASLRRLQFPPADLGSGLPLCRGPERACRQVFVPLPALPVFPLPPPLLSLLPLPTQLQEFPGLPSP